MYGPCNTPCFPFTPTAGAAAGLGGFIPEEAYAPSGYGYPAAYTDGKQMQPIIKYVYIQVPVCEGVGRNSSGR